jgi:hypothetical protein
MFATPVSDLIAYGSRVNGATYSDLIAALPPENYLFSVSDTDHAGKNKQALLIETKANFDALLLKITKGFRFNNAFYRAPKDYFPDYLQLVDSVPPPKPQRSTYYFPYTLNSDASLKEPAILVQDFAIYKAFWDDESERWVEREGGQFPIDFKSAKDVLSGLIWHTRVTDSLTTKITNTTFVNLSLTKTITIPLSSNLVLAQFVCTDKSVTWDESDLVLITGKTPAQILAAPLTSKIAVIGDSSQTFEMHGVKSPGPFIYRDPGTVQISRDGGFLDQVFRVTPMLLQPLQANITGTGGAGNVPAIITGNTPVTVKPFDRVVLGGTGEINLSGFAASGDWLEIKWNGSYTVTVKCPATYKIAGIADDLTLNTALMAVSELTLTLDATAKNFLVT